MAETKKNTTEQHFEKTLWQAADKLRKNIDAAEYKHIVLGLIFLKYISDAFAETPGRGTHVHQSDPVPELTPLRREIFPTNHLPI